MGFEIKNIFNIIRRNNTVREGIVYAFFSALNNGLNFLILFGLSLVLNKSDFGILNLFNVFILIVSVVISLGTQSYFSVSFFKKNEEELKRIINSILFITSTVFVFLLLVFSLFSKNIESLVGFGLKMQILGLIYCLLQVFYFLILELYRIKETSIYYGVISTIWALLNVISTIYFCYIVKFGWEGRVYSQVLSTIPFFFFFFFLFYRENYLSFQYPKKENIKEILNFGLPLIPHSSTVWLRQGMDRYFINYYFSATIVGDYSFIYNFAGMIMMLGTAFNSTNSVFIYKKLNEKNPNFRQEINSQNKKAIVFFFIATLLAIVLTFFLIRFFIPKYQNSIEFIIPLFLMAFFQCVYYLFVNFLFFFDKTKILMSITFGTAIFHLILSYFLTAYSPTFTAYINLLSNAIICIFVFKYCNNKFLKII